MESSGVPAAPTSANPSGWHQGFLLAGILNSVASVAFHLTAIVPGLLGRTPHPPYHFLFEKLFNGLEMGLSLAILIAFIAVLRGARLGRWIATWTLAAWIVAVTYRLTIMGRFYDPEAVRLAAILYLAIPIPTLLVLLFGFRRKTDRFWTHEGALLGLIALALLPVYGVATWKAPFDHGRDIKGLGFSPDGTTLAAADWNGVTLWRFPSGERLYRIQRPLCEQVAFSPDGALLAVASEYGNAVTLYSTKTWEVVRTIPLNTLGNLGALRYSPDGRTLAVAGHGIAVLDAETGQVVMARPMEVATDSGLSLAYSPDGERLAVGTYDGKSVLLIKIRDRSEFWKAAFPVDVRSVRFSPDGATIAVALVSGESGLQWDEANHRVLRIGPEQSALSFLDSASGRRIPGAPMFSGSVHDLAYSRDGRFLGWTGGLCQIQVAEIQGKREVVNNCFPERIYRTHYAGSGDVLAFSPDGRYVASGGDVGRVAIWDLSTGGEMK